MVILNAENVTYAYSEEFVGIETEFKLHCPSLTVSEHEIIYIVGPNGSGKSTLLSLLSEERRPAEGHVTLRSPRSGKPRIATLQARDHELLIGNLSVGEHIIAAMKINGGRQSQPDMQKRGWFYWNDCGRLTRWLADERVARFVSNSEFKQVRFLSSGQRQLLILLLLTIGRSPDIIFADEPTSHLDDRHAEALFTTISSLGTAAVIVTHDLEAASRHADSIYLVDDGRVLHLDDAMARMDSLSGVAAKMAADLAEKRKKWCSDVPGS